ncbi:MAG: DUF7344 domain-containing protein [Natronomonas sp.]
MSQAQTIPQTQVESAPETADDDNERVSSVPLDVVFGLLKNERRRLVLKFLEESDGGTSLSDLAEHIAAEENGKAVSALSSQERKRVYIGLYQCHLPQMDDSGAVEFDKNRGTVRDGPNIDQFLEYLERPEPTRSRWSRYYLGHTAVSLALVVGALVAYEALATAFFALSIIGFAALAVLHTSHARN